MSEVSVCNVKLMKKALENLPDDMLIIVRGNDDEPLYIDGIKSVQHLFGDHDDNEEKYVELSLIDTNDEVDEDEDPPVETTPEVYERSIDN